MIRPDVCSRNTPITPPKPDSHTGCPNANNPHGHNEACRCRTAQRPQTARPATRKDHR